MIFFSVNSLTWTTFRHQTPHLHAAELREVLNNEVKGEVSTPAALGHGLNCGADILSSNLARI